MKMDEIKKILGQINFDGVNFRKIATISACTLVGGLMFSLVLFPSLIKSLIRQNMQLKPGSEMRAMFEKVPFPLDFKMYLFHVINPDDVMKGGKPRVREVGPYFFEEWKEKYDTEDNEADDTMTFNLKNTWIFRPDLSVPLTGNEIITIPHPLILGALLMIQRDKEAMLPMISKALDIVMHPMTTGFLTTRVMDLLFDGILIDCSSEEFEAVALCAGLDSEGAVARHNETHVKFSMFGLKNGTDAGRFKVYRGIKNVLDIGRLVSYNDETEMDIYDGEVCNQYIGTDSTIFPPLLTKKDKLWAWSPDICQSIGAHYAGKSSYAGLPMSLYKLDFGDLRKDPKHQCFCRNPPDGCPPSGTIDLAPCVKGPIIASKPHFLGADPKLLAAVDGLTPNEKDHEVLIYFHLLSGTPVSAFKRLMFSMEMEPIRDHELLGKLPKVIFPMFWAEEGASLNKTWTNQLKYTLFLGLRINSTIKWLSIVFGTIGLIGAGLMHYYVSTKTVSVINSVIPINPVNEKSGKPRGNGVAPELTNNNNNNSSSNDKNSTVIGHVTVPVIPADRDVVSIRNIRNLAPVVEGLDKSPKVIGTEVQKERF